MVQIETHFDPDAPPVLADSTQLYQVVMNLGTNAAHAMGQQGGRITVRLDTVTVAPGAAGLPPDLRGGRHVLLTISDTGCGMDAATLERIFEPFFTTKPVGEGTGLGLSVVHGIVRSHEGAIAVDSRPGAGTTVRIYIPEADATPAGAVPETGEVRGQGEHILYVDDEDTIVDTTSHLLERLGYRVTGFTDARQALEAFRSRAADFDAVVTDLAMPGLPGPDLARELRRLRPDVPLLFTSGYVRPEELELLRAIPRSSVVLKPDLVTGLGPALHRLLLPGKAIRAARTPTRAARGRPRA
jgi:CheY-like chemotaxis protein